MVSGLHTICEDFLYFEKSIKAADVIAMLGSVKTPPTGVTASWNRRWAENPIRFPTANRPRLQGHEPHIRGPACLSG